MYRRILQQHRDSFSLLVIADLSAVILDTYRDLLILYRSIVNLVEVEKYLRVYRTINRCSFKESSYELLGECVGFGTFPVRVVPGELIETMYRYPVPYREC